MATNSTLLLGINLVFLTALQILSCKHFQFYHWKKCHTKQKCFHLLCSRTISIMLWIYTFSSQLNFDRLLWLGDAGLITSASCWAVGWLPITIRTSFIITSGTPETFISCTLNRCSVCCRNYPNKGSFEQEKWTRSLSCLSLQVIFYPRPAGIKDLFPQQE